MKANKTDAKSLLASMQPQGALSGKIKKIAESAGRGDHKSQAGATAGLPPILSPPLPCKMLTQIPLYLLTRMSESIRYRGDVIVLWLFDRMI